jgi:septum formation protein
VSSVWIDERFHSDEAPQAAVARLARSKAEAVAGLHRDAIVIAADTTVVVGGEALGKPVNAADASRMLRLLSGRGHDVLTGVCLCLDGRTLVYVERTVVRVARLSEEDIAWYVATGEPHDKAGAYAIQGLGSRFIEAIEGSYSNVVGLPISSVYERLKDLGCDILGSTKTL